jgi:hypothetical protein
MRAMVVEPAQGKLTISGGNTRYEDEHSLSLADADAGVQVILLKEPKTAWRIPLKSMGPAVNLYEIFRNPDAAVSKPIADYVDKSGRRYPGLGGRTTVGGTVGWEADIEVWSDPTTKLPVRMKIVPINKADTESLLFEQFEFDVPVDQAQFDTTIPPGYKLVGVPFEKLRTPTDDEVKQLTIEPTVGIGKVKFGMARDEIVAILGEPDFTQHNIYLNYPSLGLQLVLVGREPDKLGLIIANPMDLDALTRNEFPGQTDKGIRIGSTRKEVIAAYGKFSPPKAEDKQTRQMWEGYDDLNLSFSFVNGKVGQIIAARKD